MLGSLIVRCLLKASLVLSSVFLAVAAEAQTSLIAVATTDTPTVTEGDTVTLDGSGSMDPLGRPLNYVWRVEGFTDLLDDSTAVRPTFVAPEGTSLYLLDFRLLVIAPDGSRATADLTITVNADDDRPVANAGPVQTVSLGDTVTLDGSDSDDDGNINRYQWNQALGQTPVISLTAGTTDSPTFIAPTTSGTGDAPFPLSDYTLTITLTVTDNGAASEGGPRTDTAEVTIFVRDNDPPTAEAGSDQTVEEGDVVTLRGSGTDSDGDTLDFTWAALAGVSLSSITAEEPTFSAPNRTATYTLTLTLTVSDGTFEDEDTVVITVNAINNPPTLAAGSDRNDVAEGDTVRLAGTATNPDEGEVLDILWSQDDDDAVSVSLAGETTLTPSFTAPQSTAAYVVNLTLAAADSTQTVRDSVVIRIRADNNAPMINAGDDRNAAEGDIVALSATATDPEGEVLDLLWSQADTDTLSVSLSDATILNPTFTAPASAVPYSVILTLAVADAAQTVRDSVVIRIRVNNAKPTAEAGPDQTVEEGDVVTLRGSGTDSDGDTLDFTWTVPAGVSLSTLTISNPTFIAPNRTATYTLTLTVSDGSLEDEDTVVITVNADDDDPPVANAGDDQFAAGVSVVTLDGSNSFDPEGGGLIYEWTQVFPSEVTVILNAANTARPFFTPPLVSTDITLVFRLRVFDESGLVSASDTMSVELSPDDADVHEALLPEIMAAVATSVSSAIRTRIAAIRTPAANSLSIGGNNRFASILQQQASRYAQTRQLSLQDLLDNSSFTLALDKQASADCLHCGLTLFGQASYRSLSDGSTDNNYSGNLRTLSVGLDSNFSQSLLIGGLVHSTQGDFDYASTASSGTYEIELTSVHPYLALFLFHDRLKLWANAGLGTGEATVSSGTSDRKSDLEMDSWTLGGSLFLFSACETDFNLLAEVTNTDMNVSSAVLVSGITTSSSRAKLAFEMQQLKGNPSRGELYRSLSVGYLSDSGDSSLDSGLEIATRLGYTRGRTSFEVSFYGLSDLDAYEEWGISSEIRIQTVETHGLSLSLKPTYGSPETNAQHHAASFWEAAWRPKQTPDFSPDMQLSATLGYAFLSARGLLTPYVESFLKPTDTTTTTGLRWRPLSLLSLDFSHTRSNSDEGLRVKVQWDF